MNFPAKTLLSAVCLSLLPVIASAGTSSSQTSMFQAAPERVAFFGLGLSAKEKRMRALKKDASRLIRNPPKTTYKETAMGCMAVAVYHEARNQPIMGQKAVASVIVQRAMTPNRWGDKPCDVVRPVQFSFMTSRYRYPPISDPEAWQLAVRVALTIMYEGPMAELRGADHYHADYVSPKWRHAMHKTARIGDHIFYSDPDSLPLTYVSR
jgi:spore germination cell wall hydrolase CwlJ-like protein